MERTISSQRTMRRPYSRVTYPVLKAATGGDIDAMTLIQRHYEPYIRSLATVSVYGTSFLNTDLYDRLKTRLILSTLKFKP
ncbi:MAG: helix-turn-helix domain-containing protein [Clostridiales Family XIII bacterium]|nr:helix-turn-helix domain-containing protein [Clostridiales Family XIII bacterium]